MKDGPKKPHGRPKNVPFVSPEEAVKEAIESTGRIGIRERTGLSSKDAEILRRAVGLTESEFREKHEAQLRATLDELLGRIRDEMGMLTPAQKAITFGILSDKLNLAPKSVTNALHLHFKGGDRKNVLASLLGSEGKRLVFVPPKPEGIDRPIYLAPAVGPVIELDPTPKTPAGD